MSENKTTMKLNGAAALTAALKALPQIAEEKVMRDGVVKSAARLRTYMRRATSRVSGLLAKSINTKRRRSKKGEIKVTVGLTRNFYYKVLDLGRKAFTRKDGTEVAATRQFEGKGTQIEKTWESKRVEIANMIVEEATKSFAREAGKLAVKSKRSGK
jgi:hypothetical protein